MPMSYTPPLLPRPPSPRTRPSTRFTGSGHWAARDQELFFQVLRSSVSVVPSAVQDEVLVGSSARASVGGRGRNPAGDSKEASCTGGGNAPHFSSSASQLSIPVLQPPAASLAKAWATGTYTLQSAPPRRESEPSALSTNRMFPFSRGQAWVAVGCLRAGVGLGIKCLVSRLGLRDGMPREQAWVRDFLQRSKW